LGKNSAELKKKLLIINSGAVVEKSSNKPMFPGWNPATAGIA
jgi:hypothetical protein